MKNKKLLLLPLLSLLLSSCSLLPRLQPRRGSSNSGSDIDYYSTENKSHNTSSENNELIKTIPTLDGSEYQYNDYLYFDEYGYVSGLKYAPENRTLFIDAPINSHAFEGMLGFDTVFLGSGCTYIGEYAFNNCPELLTVVIDSYALPLLVNDTFCCTWDPEGFRVYVYDEVFNEMYEEITNDTLWNDFHQRFLARLSEAPDEILGHMGFYAAASARSIQFEIKFYDPDNAIEGFEVSLKLGNEVVDVVQGRYQGSFNNLLSSREYIVEVMYRYDINDGVGLVEEYMGKRVTTKPVIEPYVMHESNTSSEGLTYDARGYVNGLSIAPTDGVLYINNPIAELAFQELTSFHTVVLGEGCSYIGRQAFSWCPSLRTIIIDRSSFPTLVDDTFCGSWDPEDFGVYVRDEIYTSVKNLQTQDTLWNTEHRDRQLHNFSELTHEQQQLLIQSSVIPASNYVSFEFYLFDPDNTIRGNEIELREADNTDVLYYTNDLVGTFYALESKTDYALCVRLFYDKNTNESLFAKEVTIYFTTL